MGAKISGARVYPTSFCLECSSLGDSSYVKGMLKA